jgi:2'-5' RNA ligase
LIGSEEDIILKTSRLVALIHPFKIRLGPVNPQYKYFRYLLTRLKNADKVFKANLKARKIFNQKYDPEYIPHLSLMYGNSSQRIKEKIIDEMGKDFEFSFEVRSIHLFSTSGKPKDWCRIKEFHLK